MSRIHTLKIRSKVDGNYRFITDCWAGCCLGQADNSCRVGAEEAAILTLKIREQREKGREERRRRGEERRKEGTEEKEERKRRERKKKERKTKRKGKKK